VSGEDGLRAAEQVRPAAIIVDGIMPGIDGATVVRRIRQDAALRRTPCILLTASEDMADELRALDAGADAYVRKDDGNTVILAKLMAILRSVGAPATHDSTASLFGPKKVLAVDDSPTYLNSISEQLRAEGYGVVLARSGEEALELLAAQSVDCILLDLLMPGLSGEETCRRIKNSPEWRDIPLLILTAREERESMIEGINAGADDYISKSSDPAVLSARLRAQLRRRQFEDENRNIHEELLKKELEARAAQTLAQARAELMGQIEQKNRDLEYANRELEAFCYSVSHDLRAPLRTIDSFSRLLIEDHLATLDDAAQSHLKRIRRATERMSDLIDDMLELSNASRGIMLRESLDLSPVAQEVAAELQAPFSPGTPGATRRDVTFHIEPNLEAYGDWRLLRVLFENLLGNAWKFTQKRDKANIWVGRERRTDSDAFFVRDDGAGFDMAYAQKLFQPFSRLHNQDEFEGTGIGLATVQRIISRHGGRVWAESGPEGGATFWFTLPKGAIPA
jgi:DNA-binding response OmpR family regulator